MCEFKLILSGGECAKDLFLRFLHSGSDCGLSFGVNGDFSLRIKKEDSIYEARNVWIGFINIEDGNELVKVNKLKEV